MSTPDIDFARKVLADPYPPGIFTELAPDDWDKIHDALERCGVRNASGRMHASWSRHLYSNFEFYAIEASS